MQNSKKVCDQVFESFIKMASQSVLLEPLTSILKVKNKLENAWAYFRGGGEGLGRRIYGGITFGVL